MDIHKHTNSIPKVSQCSSPTPLSPSAHEKMDTFNRDYALAISEPHPPSSRLPLHSYAIDSRNHYLIIPPPHRVQGVRDVREIQSLVHERFDLPDRIERCRGRRSRRLWDHRSVCCWRDHLPPLKIVNLVGSSYCCSTR